MNSLPQPDAGFSRGSRVCVPAVGKVCAGAKAATVDAPASRMMDPAAVAAAEDREQQRQHTQVGNRFGDGQACGSIWIRV